MRLFLSTVIWSLILVALYNATPLDDYVNTPDPHYKYALVETYEQPDYTLYILNMTSQKWLDETFSSQPIWWHYVSIAVPRNLTRKDAAFMMIDGGHNENNFRPPKPDDDKILQVSLNGVFTGAISAVVLQIPNQPIVFKDDPTQQKRTEDAIIAFTWKTFFENSHDATVLLRLPMTKAAVRAMDSIQDFVAKSGIANIKKFMIAGKSKRGWTTWTTAAVDERVYAAAPIVMDLVNINECMHNHFKALGGWTNQFYDYWVLNITKKMDTPEMVELTGIVDPYTYLNRYRTKHMLVISTSGDEFFLPQDTKHFWGDLSDRTNGNALMLRIPNAEHSLKHHEILLFEELRSFFLSTYEGSPLPKVSWTMPNNASHGIIRAIVDTSDNRPAPTFVSAYYATTLSSSRIDFRMFIMDPKNPEESIPNPVVWHIAGERHISKTVLSSTQTQYELAMLKPLANTGWLGFYIMFGFRGLDKTILDVSTETNVIPETYKHPDCYRDSCYGTLV